jgi:Flp pilus assembly protein TadD
MGRVEEAKAVLDTAVDLEPDMPSLYEKRAVLLDKLGKAKDAEKDRKKAKALHKKLAEEKKKRK